MKVSKDDVASHVCDLPIVIRGCGAVSPSGWGCDSLLECLLEAEQRVEPVVRSERVVGAFPTFCRRVPKPQAPLPFLREARLRRTSAISHFAVAASLEAIGEERIRLAREGALRLGVIYTIVNGCVNFSRRFYSEVLSDPRMASPLVFPETVFNAPASHLSALLGSKAINYTLVGDSAQFVASLDVASQWLEEDECDGVVICCAEEFDWLSAEACAMLDRNLIVSEGGAALYLERAEKSAVGWVRPQSYSRINSKAQAAERVVRGMGSEVPDLLVDGLTGAKRTDREEREALGEWQGQRLSPKRLLGEGLGVGVGWQAVVAASMVLRGNFNSAGVLAIGANQQASGAIFYSDSSSY